VSEIPSECDASIELRIVRHHHDAHAAHAELREQVVAADSFTRLLGIGHRRIESISRTCPDERE
jgi:hypothetical protein